MSRAPHFLACALALVVAACSTPNVAPLRLQGPVVLLGEVHDNAAQHRLRAAALAELLATGARPALAMEQFDREQQPRIDALLAQRPRPSADAFIAAVGGANWQWAYYRPFIELALQQGLPIVAANVSREDARSLSRDGLAQSGFDAAVAPDILKEQADIIEGSHCGMLNRATAERLALAQVARDQFMARVIERHAARGVVLLAGNGHVRTDIGVPRWLAAATRAQSQAIGLLEEGDAPEAATFDLRVVTPAQPRPDPCEAMRRPPK
jgi:uncharacterized iron-regulated protein